MSRSRSLRRTLASLVVWTGAGYLAALVVPRQRWRSRPAELPAGPWPPLQAQEESPA